MLLHDIGLVDVYKNNACVLASQLEACGEIMHALSIYEKVLFFISSLFVSLVYERYENV